MEQLFERGQVYWTSIKRHDFIARIVRVESSLAVLQMRLSRHLWMLLCEVK